MSAWAAGGGTDRDSDSTQVGAAAGGGGYAPPPSAPLGWDVLVAPGFPGGRFHSSPAVAAPRM